MLSVMHMDQSLNRVICGRRVLCPVKCIYAYLAQRSEIVTQDFTEFFITFGNIKYIFMILYIYNEL